MANILKYSNGWGHLIMSLAFLAVGVYLTAFTPNVGYGIGLITTVASAWFVPGAAKQVAYEVKKSASQTTAAAVQAATGATDATNSST